MWLRRFIPHKCKFEITHYSNILQQDDMGYPLCLCIETCSCGESRHAWVDIDEKVLLDPNFVLLKWKPV